MYHDLQASQQKYAELASQHQKLATEHQSLEDKFKEATNKLADMTKERDEQLRLAEGVNWSGSAKVADDIVTSKWKQLDYNIRCMARTLAECPTRRPTNDVVKKRFSLISLKWTKLLDDEDYKEFIFHAYIWVVVVHQIFHDRDGTQGHGFVSILKELREELVGK